MKKLVTTQPGGGPIHQDDLRTVFNSEIWYVLEATFGMFNGDTQGVIVSGCILTPNGGNWDISEGLIYLNGEFMRLAAATNQALPKYIQPAAAVNDDRQFADAVTRTLFITKGAELAGSAPGGSQYVAITTSTDPDDRRLQNLIHLRQDVINALNNTSTDKALSAAQGKVLKDTADALATLVASKVDLVETSAVELQAGLRTQSSGSYLKFKLIDIGDWNMDTTDSVNVTHGLDVTKLRSVDVMLRHDNGVDLVNLERVHALTFDLAGAVDWNSTLFVLTRKAGGTFDSTSYDSTSFNRGFILAWYEA